jgi:hypothetical protein
MYAIGGCFIVALPSSSALFFFRVKAVYGNNRIITVLFGTLLFALFAVSFINPFASKVTHLGPTNRCIVIAMKKIGFLPAVLNFLYDTLVFFSISFRIVSRDMESKTFGAFLRSFFRGDGLPAFSRALLQGGQLYYWFVGRKKKIVFTIYSIT